jgi:hypothetical protein
VTDRGHRTDRQGGDKEATDIEYRPLDLQARCRIDVRLFARGLVSPLDRRATTERQAAVRPVLRT